MATLQNAQIDQSFGALLKTDDNGNITATAKAITDGAGNATNMEMSNTETKFSSGTVDFTGATVIGVGGGGAAGLEPGTGSDNMKSSATLTTIAATATGDGSIVLGNDATDGGSTNVVAIGDGCQAKVATNNSIAIGQNVIGSAFNQNNIGIGRDINYTGRDAVALGTDIDDTADSSVAIGDGVKANGAKAIAIGKGAQATAGESMAYGEDAQATATSAAAFGQYAEATNTYAIAFGRTSAASGDGAVAFGQQTSAAQAGAVAMGRQVTADTADTTHVRALKIVAPNGGTGGNGITMLSPDGTASEVTVTNNQELAINGTAIGGGGGTVSFYGTPWTLNTQSSQDLVYETFTIPGGTFTVGDVIEISTIEFRDGLNNWGYSSLWISDTAQTVGNAPVSSANNFSLAQKQSPSARENIYYNKKMFIKSNGTMVMPINATNDVDGGQSGDPTETYNINWANDQYFFYQLWNDSTSGSYTTSGTLLKKLN